MNYKTKWLPPIPKKQFPHNGQARVFSSYWRGWLRAGEENLSIGGAKLHPTQKPIALMEWCINLSKHDDGILVLDPYMGSGTTLLAAKRLDHRAIGIEIDKNYCSIAIDRLRQMELKFG